MANAAAPPIIPIAKRPWLLAGIVSAAMFMAQLDSTIIATALPNMARSFHTGATNLSLGISIYLLVQAVLLPASNWVSERFGARRVFAGAMLLFTLASGACGLSASFGAFIAARVAQGGAAALMTPVGRVVLVRTTPKPDLVQVLTMVSMPMLLAPMLGPPVGGFIVSFASWPWVFYLNLPVGAVGVAAILAFVPDIRSGAAPRFDWTGFVLLGVALAGLIYGFDRITAPHNSRILAGGCIAVGAAFTALAIRHSRRAAHPLLSPRPFASAVFRAIAGGAGGFARLPMRAVPFVMPLALQLGMGLSPFRSGVLLMASAAGDIAVKPLVRPLLARTGFRMALAGSQLVSCLAIGGLALAVLGAPAAALFALLGVLGAARSVLFSGMSALLYADIDDADAGAATVVWNVVQQVTNAFAVSFSVILINLSAGSSRPGVHDFALTLAVLAAIGAPALIAFLRLPRDAGAALSGHAPPA